MTQLNTDVASVILEYAVLFDILFPGCKRQCYNRNIQKISSSLCIDYILFKKLHREDDLPAVIHHKSGNRGWYYRGKLHRDNDLPAQILSDGTQGWYYCGKLHRDNDLPAQIFSDGIRVWCCRGKIHRDKNPAIIYPDGSGEWHFHGIKNRLGGTYLEDKKYYSSINLHS
jgi:hypothetical protein